MLYAHIESYGVGQSDTYIVPIAYAGDTTLMTSRLSDMPDLDRDGYLDRLKKKEFAISKAFAEYVGEGETMDGVMAYLDERVEQAKGDGLKRYQMAINLLCEDLYHEGVPFVMDMRECSVKVEYDHTLEREPDEYREIPEGTGLILGVHLSRAEAGNLDAIWAVELEDKDSVVSFSSDDGDFFVRPHPEE